MINRLKKFFAGNKSQKCRTSFEVLASYQPRLFTFVADDGRSLKKFLDGNKSQKCRTSFEAFASRQPRLFAFVADGWLLKKFLAKRGGGK